MPSSDQDARIHAAYAGKLAGHRANLRAALKEIAESKEVNTVGLAIKFRDMARRALAEDDR